MPHGGVLRKQLEAAAAILDDLRLAKCFAESFDYEIETVRSDHPFTKRSGDMVYTFGLD